MSVTFKQWIGIAILSSLSLGQAQAATEFLNVSYDPTRELYDEYNKSFGTWWKQRTGEAVNFKQSHGGSGKQARSVIDGLDADVVTLALGGDIDAIANNSSLIPKDWQSKLPNNAAPYTSTIVFLVRKGNPKGIKDWGDLTKTGVEVVTPNPKTSGGARWNYLAAWAWAKKQPRGSDLTAQEFVRKIYANTKVLDSGARGALTTFAERGIGDVLISWENEAHLATRSLEKGAFEIIVPSISILAEPSVAVVEGNAKKHGTENLARGYLNYLYSPVGQELAAKHYFRPRNASVAARYKHVFLPVKLFTIDQEFGGWSKATATHFANGGIFDQIVEANSRLAR